MRVIVDGDGFPSVKEVINLAKKYNKEIIVYIDLNHEMTSDYAKIEFVSPGMNAVDLVIQNNVLENDLVLTNDYGVAVVALAKNAKCINANGKVYNNQNIDYLMEQRYMNYKLRKHQNIKGPKKRTKEDKENLLKVIEDILR